MPDPMTPKRLADIKAYCEMAPYVDVHAAELLAEVERLRAGMNTSLYLELTTKISGLRVERDRLRDEAENQHNAIRAALDELTSQHYTLAEAILRAALEDGES